MSSIIRHSRLPSHLCEKAGVLDHDEIRERLRGRLEELGLSLTGKWLKDYGVGQTTVRNFLDGMTQSLTVETVGKLAEPLKTTEHWLLFGTDKSPLPSEDELSRMIARAMGELPVGVTYEDYPTAVSSHLHEQLRLYQAAGGFRKSPDHERAQDTGAQLPSPTSPDGGAALRN